MTGYDYSKLCGKMVEKFKTQYRFAIALGISERSLSLRLNGKVSWRDVDITNAIKLLDLSVEDIPEYFFKEKVHVV